MKPLSLFILWLVGFVFITLLCIKFNGSTIENELTQQTRQTLANNGFRSVTPTINGQVITLTGNAVSNEDSLQAESIIKSIDGVAEVNNQRNVDNIIDRSTAPMTATKSNPVYPPQQISITDKPIENHHINQPHALANINNNRMPQPNNTNNFQMPFWGNNNTPLANGFIPLMPPMPNMPISPIAPVAPTAPLFPFESFFPMQMPMQ